MTLSLSDIQKEFHSDAKEYSPKTPIDGVEQVALQPWYDERGFFMELARKQVTDEKNGITGIDRVMNTGFNWASPSLLVHMLGGRDGVIELIQSQNLPVPDALRTDTTCDQYVFNAGKYFPAK